MSELKDLSAQSVEIAEDGSASLVCETTDGKRYEVALENLPAEVEEAPVDPAADSAEGEQGEPDGEEQPPA